jgi:hypothetical protein
MTVCSIPFSINLSDNQFDPEDREFLPYFRLILRQILEQEMGVPVALLNDATAYQTGQPTLTTAAGGPLPADAEARILAITDELWLARYLLDDVSLSKRQVDTARRAGAIPALAAPVRMWDWHSAEQQVVTVALLHRRARLQLVLDEVLARAEQKRLTLKDQVVFVANCEDKTLEGVLLFELHGYRVLQLSHPATVAVVSCELFPGDAPLGAKVVVQSTNGTGRLIPG